ncbi:pentapeptide repeat-containing protein (plasmid) [Pantoea sp. BJ2]|uniref:E3 ubiquitin-protein ligase SopA n=1 Tax=Pantoea sp. BJ2 TaxID=3141322 RepID=A0AAU7U3T3_9GAMM
MSSGKATSELNLIRKVKNVLIQPPEIVLAKKIHAKTYENIKRGNISDNTKFNFSFDFKNARVEFKQDPHGAVKVYVSDRFVNDHILPEIEVNIEDFKLISRALDFKNKHEISSTKPLLTKNSLINLQKAYLDEAKLNGWLLTKTDMTKAYLHLADLREVNFTDSVLDKACLQDTILDLANLTRVSMNQTNLSRAYLNHACLDSAIMCSADLYKAKLKHASLKNSILTDANLYKANLKKADLETAILERANLTSANMKEANLKGVNLEGADLRNANLDGACLENAELSYAKLNGASWTGAVFSGVNFKNAHLTIPQNIIWSLHTLNSILNYDNSGKSILTSIQSIDICFEKEKIDLVKQLKTSLEEQGFFANRLSFVAESIISTLTDPPFNKDETIAKWCEDILEGILMKYDSKPLLQKIPKKWASLSIKIFDKTPLKMLKFNALFNQLTNYIMHNGNDEEKSEISMLYKKYLDHPKINQWANFPVDGVCTPTENLDLEKNDDPLILLPAGKHDLQNKPFPLVMVVAREDFNNMLRSVTDSWLKYFIYTQPNGKASLPLGKIDPKELFQRHFPIFLQPYHSKGNSQIHQQLLNVLFPQHPELQKLFRDATKSRTGSSEIGTELLTKINDIFKKLLDITHDWGGLKHSHILNLLTVYDIKAEETKLAAETLLCLSAIFTRYTSDGVFGSELESPEILRRYAFGLLHEATKLDSNIVQKEIITDWMNRLSGKEQSPTCSYNLSNDMDEYLQVHCKLVRNKITPLAWL